MNFERFKKLNCSKVRANGYYVKTVTNNNKIYVSPLLVEDAALKSGDRVDLYYHDGVFALKKSTVGCLTLRSGGTGGSLAITSLAMRLEMAVHTKHVGIFHAWYEDGVIYFTEQEDKVNEK